jgi:hypothetical protein
LKSTEEHNRYKQEIEELDAKLDGLYVNLRKTLGIGSWQNKQKQKAEESAAATQQDVNLEDIAVIKKKTKQKPEE